MKLVIWIFFFHDHLRWGKFVIAFELLKGRLRNQEKISRNRLIEFHPRLDRLGKLGEGQTSASTSPCGLQSLTSNPLVFCFLTSLQKIAFAASKSLFSFKQELSTWIHFGFLHRKFLDVPITVLNSQRSDARTNLPLAPYKSLGISILNV